MQSNPFIYSLKTWLTSVALAPLMFLVVESCLSHKSYLTTEAFINEQLETYVMCLVFGGFFSLLTWLLFFLIIKVITIYLAITQQIRFVIAGIGLLLTLGTFAIFFPAFELHNEFFYLMVSNCICIAGGSLYYRLEISTEAEGITT